MADALTPKVPSELKHQLEGALFIGSCWVALRAEECELDLNFARFDPRRIEGNYDRSVRCRVNPGVIIDLRRLVGGRV